MNGHDRKIIFSNKSDDWATPPELYEELNKEFHFNFDPCPLHSTFNGLEIEWRGNIFINPPYSNVASFLEKGLEEMDKGHANLLVYLVHARTDTRWFHNYIYDEDTRKYKNNSEVVWHKGRLKFSNSKNSAPFPSMIVIFRRKKDEKEDETRNNR